MAIYNTNSRLSEAIMTHPSLIPVVNRLGVALGVGDDSIGSLCRARGIDPAFFLSVVNTFLDERYFPANPRDTFTLEKTIDYLAKTGVYYEQSLLPNIDRHFSSLMARSGENNNLHLLRNFFDGMREQLGRCLRYDVEVLYPALAGGWVPEGADAMAAGHSEVEEKLHDLLYFFVSQLSGDYDRNLCVAVVSAVFSLERDIHQNNRIRQRILLPLIGEIRSRNRS